MKTLRGKFVFSIFTAYLIIGSLTLFAFYVGAVAVVRDFGARSAATHALLQKNKILSIVDREVGLALKFADDPVIRKWSREMQQPEGGVLDQLESYRKAFRDSSYFVAQTVSNRLFVSDPKRRQIRISALDKEMPWGKWFHDALKNVDSYVLHLDYLPAEDDFKVRVNAVLRDEAGEKVGFAGGAISISEFMDEVEFSSEKGIHTIIADRNGAVLAHENREFVKRNATTWDDSRKATLETLFEKPAERERLRGALAALARKESAFETFPLSLNSKTYIAAVAYMEGISWYNIVLLDTSQVLKKGDFLPVFVVVLLSLVLMPFVVALMLGRIVLDPLSDLTEATGRVSRGEYSISLPVARNDELGRLTTAFNSLTATVLDYTGNLEQKVAERTSELSEANRKLREAQKQVVDSIEYARMVQASVLPGPSDLGRCLGKYALLNMPKDIVGGDSYYFRSLSDGFVLAVIDCTGHGVPGALIAMSVNAVLNNIPDTVFRQGPDKALCELNRLIRDTLHHFDSSQRAVDSGLDIGLCLCLPSEGRVFFAGANLSLYCTNGADVLEIQGDRKPLGYGRSDVDCQYASHEVAVRDHMAFYLTTDGILDQPGPSGSFGMGRQRFREMIASIIHLPMREQEEALRFQLNAYRGSAPQRDDILLLGFTLPGGLRDA